MSVRNMAEKFRANVNVQIQKEQLKAKAKPKTHAFTINASTEINTTTINYASASK